MNLIESKVYWAEACTYHPESEIEEHSHDFFHYIYVVKGSGRINIDGRLHEFIPKHMYLLAPGKKHSFCNTREENLVTIEIKFEFFDEELMKEIAKLPEVLDVSETPIKRILTNIKRECANKKLYFEDIVTMNMHEIFSHLKRVEKTKETENKTEVPGEISKVIEYINENLERDINLQELADVLCFEKTYFLKKFKSLMGITPMSYTRNMRIERAKELLKYSDMNITQISEAVGFLSLHHFSKQFSKCVGMSPSKFKTENSI